MSRQPAPAGKTRVLVADDRHENRFLLQSVLESSGFEVQLANNGQEALDCARKNPPDLIISDITMPKMDGFQLCRAVKADEHLVRIPFIFYTATYTEEKDERFALSLGAEEFLVKPIGPVEFVNRIQKVLEGGAREAQPEPRPPDELEYFREYSQRLVEKLERKIEEVEVANRKLQALNTTLEDKVAQRTAELERKNQELAASNAELQAFAYTAAHDLRAPLRGIQGFSAFLGDELALQSTAAARSHLERIKRSAAQMEALIQDLLDYSRVASTPIRLAAIPLKEVVQQIVSAHELEIQERDARIQIDVDDIRVLAVEGTLRQAIENLLSNALKFVRPGAVPEVRIAAERKGRYVCLWVEDKGVGIAPEYHERIFQVFERLHQQGTYPGTGIGLAIVRKAVERMGGKVGVESEVGKGSRFWIELKQAT